MSANFKEKLRIRSYGTPNPDTPVFLEIKKKYKGVVYKRRVSLKLDEAFKYIESKEPPMDTQIMREIDYLMRFYRYPEPNVCILCEREAYFWQENVDVRLTFDKNIRYRQGFPNSENVSDGTKIIEDDEYILEKTPLGEEDAINMGKEKLKNIAKSIISLWADGTRDLFEKILEYGNTG